jgi:single-strand DNA-binding protein
VEGSIQTRSYDAQDGGKRYVTEIVADGIEFLGSGANASQGDTATDIEHAKQQAKQAMRDEDVKNGFTEVDGDELPF